ncbi:dipicolinate synthase subunit DpsA [Natranaerobius trueperi]|uniref:Dipicolinic acid synthetase subunit A n=1 Tax=Natranaerobius trueperi TaxID=759412 RepID=A0A226C1I5_9FIRM|nr:dipicolinate synthase subunit DpsA [Natranaerobius trueperi]OWZ84299.1 dipicolinic acid synthetase subunit A [Natranaerobius trueperi]
MNKSPVNHKVVVLGGDERDIFLIKHLKQAGIDVFAIGFDRVGYKIEGTVLYTMDEIEEEQINAIILPLAGVDSEGNVPASNTTKKLNFWKETKNLSELPLILIGSASKDFKSLVEKRGGSIVETIDLDDIAIYNSIPTAEGAIFEALKNSNLTIHSSDSLVLGLGRCGITLARLLKNMSSNVTVAVRRPAQLARAEELGASAIYINELSNYIKDFQLIFNTIPALILKEDIINKLSPEAVIIDIASGQGGTDFKACREKNIKGILAPGLPGKIAPQTAGEILGKVYPRLLLTHLRG